MFWQRVSCALLAGTFVAMTSLPVRAEEDEPKKDDKAPAAAAPAAPAPCAPAMRTICCVEWVPEKYTCERTVNKVEYRTEKYKACKCVCVPEKRTCTKTVMEKVPETKTVCRKVCEKVWCEEERTIMQYNTCCKPVEKTVRKCVDKGHYECRCVECKPSCLDKLRDMCKKKDCCNPCCETKCPKYKTEKCWVPCKVWEEHKVCCMEKVTTCTPVKCKVKVCKNVEREEKCQVTCYKCVARCVTEEVTVNVMKNVEYEATRCVKVCVPVVEKYEACRMVKRTVEKQVPCEPCCTPCCTPCCPKKCGGLFHKSSCCD